MKKVYENYSDQEYQLYEIVGWAMLGLIDTKNVDRPASFVGFLHDLFLDPRGGDIGGEPGWSLERIDLSEDFRAAYSFVNKRDLDALDELKGSGEKRAFWMEIQGQGENVISESSFWKVVKDAFEEFVQLHPEKKKDADLIGTMFPRLSHNLIDKR